MKKMTWAKLTFLWLSVLFALWFATMPVLAQTYYASVTLSETNGTSYTMFPALTDFNTDYLATNGYITATGLDTRMQTNGTVIPHMLADSRLAFAYPLPGNSTQPLNFTAGNAALPAFDIITGYDGYITVADAVALELGNDFEIEQDAYVDTTAGADKNLVHKASAFRTYISAAGDVTSVRAGPTNDTFEIAAVSDDCHKFWDGAAWVFSVWAMQDAGKKGVKQQYGGGMRFDSVNIAQRATITAAYVRFRANGNYANNNCNTVLQGEDSDDADTFSDVVDYDARVKTTASVNWNVIPAWTLDTWYNSPDITTIVQEIVDRAGWDSGNHMAIFWDDHADNSDNLAYREAYSYNFLPANAPELYVEWVSTGAPDGEVTATGVASGEHIVQTVGDDLLWLTSDELHVDAAVNGEVNAGNIYNGLAKLWTSFWFKFDVTFDNTAPADLYIFGKRVDGNNDIRLRFYSGTGELRLRKTHLGGLVINLTAVNGGGAPITSWTGGQWYHCLFSISDTAGARLRINNGTVATDPDNSPVPNGGNFVIGDRTVGAGTGFEGVIANFATGSDNLTVPEEADLYANIFPGDEVDLWYIDEGVGNTIYSYGSAGNDATRGAATAWQTGTRPCKLALYVDGGFEDAAARGTPIPDSNANWFIGLNNVFPYMNSHEQTVSSVLVAHYEPQSYIVGSVLPDRAGAAQNGTIVWGANPAGVSVVVGSLLAYDTGVVPAGELTVPDVAGELTEPADMFPQESEMTGIGITPIFPWLNPIATQTNTPMQHFVWVLGAMLILFVTIMAQRYIKNILLSSFIALAATGACVAMVILPWWFIPLVVLYGVVKFTMERSPSV